MRKLENIATADRDIRPILSQIFQWSTETASDPEIELIPSYDLSTLKRASVRDIPHHRPSPNGRRGKRLRYL